MSDDTANTLKPTTAEPKRRSFFSDLFMRMFKEKPLGTVGLIIVVILLMTGIFADILAPDKMNEQNLIERLRPPSGEHPFGTDQLGRDELSNIIYGARVSVIIGLSASLLMTIVSMVVGSLSALIGGKFDLLMQRLVDAWLCIPGMLILLIMMSIIGNGIWQIILAIGLPMGIGGSRVVRSAVLGIRENAYVEAGRAIGCSTLKLLVRHILPNILPILIISFSMVLGGAILMEASLSFLGYGVPPGVPSWGSMLSKEGRQYMEIMPLLSIWPGLALSVTVWGANMFGDAMRDLLDPKLRGGLGRYGGSVKKVKIRTRLQAKV